MSATSEQFDRWLLRAGPGEQIVYATQTPARNAMKGGRSAVGQAAYMAYRDGLVDLVQRRTPDYGLEYVAIRRSGRR